MKSRNILSLILVFYLTFALINAGKVRLDSIRELKFRKGQYTTSRHTSAIPQLNCESNTAHHLIPDQITCRNVGTGNNGDVLWECSANLRDGLRLENTQVSCESWTRGSEDDAYIVKGSCGLFFEIAGSPRYSASYDESLPKVLSKKVSNSGFGCSLKYFCQVVVIVGFIIFIINVIKKHNRDKHPHRYNHNAYNTHQLEEQIEGYQRNRIYPILHKKTNRSGIKKESSSITKTVRRSQPKSETVCVAKTVRRSPSKSIAKTIRRSGSNSSFSSSTSKSVSCASTRRR